MTSVSLLLLISSSLLAQNPCADFLNVLGERDINEAVTVLKQNCGPFVENTSDDGMSRTWINQKNGITIGFVNRNSNPAALPKFEVLSVELTSFTDSGGYKLEFPFGFKMGMDSRMVRAHIMQLADISYDRKDLGLTMSSFTYTGTVNATAKGRKVKVYVIQEKGSTVSAIRLLLL